MTGNDFGWALRQMKAGKAVRRTLWPTVGRPELRITVDQPTGYAPVIIWLGGAAQGEVKTPWGDQHLDILAEDWEIYE